MYSPSIHPSLIPLLYRLGKHRGQPMTQLADELILDALARVELPDGCHHLLEQAKSAQRSSLRVLEAA